MEQIDGIVAACTRPGVQRVLFSATLPDTVEELARSIMHDPVRIVVGERWVFLHTSASTFSFCEHFWTAVLVALSSLCSLFRQLKYASGRRGSTSRSLEQKVLIVMTFYTNGKASFRDMNRDFCGLLSFSYTYVSSTLSIDLVFVLPLPCIAISSLVVIVARLLNHDAKDSHTQTYRLWPA